MWWGVIPCIRCSIYIHSHGGVGRSDCREKCLDLLSQTCPNASDQNKWRKITWNEGMILPTLLLIYLNCYYNQSPFSMKTDNHKVNSHEGIDNHPAEEFVVMYAVDTATVRSHALEDFDAGSGSSPSWPYIRKKVESGLIDGIKYIMKVKMLHETTDKQRLT